MIIKSFNELKNALSNSDILEIECRGTIRFCEPLTLEHRHTLVIKGGEPEKAVFSGAEEIRGEWKNYSDTVSVCQIARGLDTGELFVDGERYCLARYPDYEPDKRLCGFTTYEKLVERLSAYQDVSSGYVRAIHDREWGGNSYFLRGVSGNELKLDWIGDNNRGGEPLKTQMMVENLFEELDSEKEWYYDKINGLLYVYFPKGTDRDRVKVEYGVIADFFKLTDCSDITIEGITFEKSNRTMFDSEYHMVTRSDWGVADRGAILAENCNGIKINRCGFRFIGGNCIHFKGKNIGNSVESCDFKHIGASGVLIYGDRSACRSLSTWEKHRVTIPDKSKGPANDLYAESCAVENCLFDTTGEYEKQSAPVTLSVAHRCRIVGNTVCNTPRAGINICDGTFGGHLIADNDIFDTVCETGDHGPFNSWGRDRYWSYKMFNTDGAFGRTKKKYCLLDAMDTTVIRHNRVTGSHGFGIDLDDGSTNYEICDNLCHGVGIKLREGFYRYVHNNIILGAQLDLHCTFCGNDDVIENNIICAEYPINCILLNRGFTTTLKGNLFAGCKEDIQNTPLFKNSAGKQNRVTDGVTTEDILNGDADCSGFRRFSLEFGREDAKKPTFNELPRLDSIHTETVGGSLLSDIDEGIKTVGGLSGCEGVYVVSAGDRLKKAGIKSGDVIVKINGMPILNIDEFKARNEKYASLEIVRNQRYMTLEH